MINLLSRMLTAVAAIITFSVTAQADKLEKFILSGNIYEMDDSIGYRSIDSVEVSLTLGDSIVVPFRIVSAASDSLPLTKSSMRLLVDGGRGKYQLRLYKEGFQPKLHEVLVSAVSQDVVWTGSIQLRRESNVMLDALEVKATAIKMVMKGDTIVYNADAFNVAEGSMLDALVRQFPGATLSPEGQIKINGRPVNELLLNGKDFFKGDPNVALQNLPAYTVKQAKVYDKSSEDAYLTHDDAKAKLGKREDEENLVMDIVLKKEFNRGWIGNVEVGYGTDNRYMDRLFGLMFTNNLRVSGFGNFNNINNSATAASNGYWQDYSSASGIQETQRGGVDYHYEKDRWRTNGSVQASNSSERTSSYSSGVNFYPSADDVYTRSASRSHSVTQNYKVSNFTHYKGNSVYASIAPSLTISNRDHNNVNRSANFTQDPGEEKHRGEIIDSLFSGKRNATTYDRYLMYRIGKIDVQNGQFKLRTQADAMAVIRPSGMKGKLTVNLWSKYTHDKYPLRSIYYQEMGPATPPNIKPTNRDSYRLNPNDIAEARSIVRYTYEHTTYTDSHRRSWEFIAAGHYEMCDNHNVNDYYIGPQEDAIRFFDQGVYLPSMSKPEGAVVDSVNTYNNKYFLNKVNANAQVRWSSRPIAESDSGINPSLNVLIDVTDQFRHHRVHRYTPTGYEGRVQRTNNIAPHFNFGFRSANKIRYINLTADYTLTWDNPSIYNLMKYTTSTNPYYIVERGLESLKAAHTHNVQLRFNYYARSNKHKPMVMLNAYFRQTVNAFSNAIRFDPLTGITYSRSINVDGNLNGGTSINWGIDFGPDKLQLNLSGYGYANFSKSVDYITASATGLPEKSVVRSFDFFKSVHMTMHIDPAKTTIGVGAQGAFQRSYSPRPDFETVNTWSYGGDIHANSDLPYNIKIETRFSCNAKRGYSDPQLNTTEFIWNASVSKSILKGDLTFRLSANDILGQRSATYISVNPQGRTETWRLILPRYAMLSVLYRFRHNPRKVEESGIYNNF
ncbi:MAG: outer membrane beta-barrel family protein [Muribaculaceae bacterium]|nr:outer membrane beta-barrel family protein [Muribaculaceae bacterium]